MTADEEIISDCDKTGRHGGMEPEWKGVLLIERVQFHALVRELLADVANEVQLTMFVFRICHHVKSGNEDENDRLQDLLSKRLHANMEQQWQKIVQYSFEGDEAQKHVDDFLEAYKYNLGHIAMGSAISMTNRTKFLTSRFAANQIPFKAKRPARGPISRDKYPT